MKEYYLLVGLNSKEVKIIDVKQIKKDIIVITVEKYLQKNCL